MTDKVEVFWADRSINCDSHSELEVGSYSKIGESDTFTNKKCAVLDMSFESIEGTNSVFNICGVGLWRQLKQVRIPKLSHTGLW